MDNFSYYDIFQTKGIEYIIIIVFLILLIPFWMVMNHKKAWVSKIKSSVNYFSAHVLKLPKGIYFSKNHTWVYMQKSGLVELGIDDWLKQLMGDSNLICFKKPGEKIQKGDIVAEIAHQNKSLKISSPISGIIAQLVQPGNSSPSEQVNYDTTIFLIKPTLWKAESRNLLLGDEVNEWIKWEIFRLKDFLSAIFNQPGVNEKLVLQEGGELRNNILPELTSENWERFQKEFLENQQD